MRASTFQALCYLLFLGLGLASSLPLHSQEPYSQYRVEKLQELRRSAMAGIASKQELQSLFDESSAAIEQQAAPIDEQRYYLALAQSYLGAELAGRFGQKKEGEALLTQAMAGLSQIIEGGGAGSQQSVVWSQRAATSLMISTFKSPAFYMMRNGKQIAGDIEEALRLDASNPQALFLQATQKTSAPKFAGGDLPGGIAELQALLQREGLDPALRFRIKLSLARALHKLDRNDPRIAQNLAELQSVYPKNYQLLSFLKKIPN